MSDVPTRRPIDRAWVDAAREDLTQRCSLPVEAFFADAFTFNAPAAAAVPETA